MLYLRGLSTSEFREALPILLGKQASGLSPSAICRLTNAWSAEYKAFRKQDLSSKQYVYVWADGVHFNVRLERDLCTLMILGVLPDGTKELIAVEDGYRESTESWAFVLRELQRRGMRAPLVAVGDGALGLWAAVRDVWPETREQRCWVHRIANVLDKLPKRLQPKAVASLQRDADKLLSFYDFPAQRWIHLPTHQPDRVDVRHRAPLRALRSSTESIKSPAKTLPDPISRSTTFANNSLGSGEEGTAHRFL